MKRFGYVTDPGRGIGAELFSKNEIQFDKYCNLTITSFKNINVSDFKHVVHQLTTTNTIEKINIIFAKKRVPSEFIPLIVQLISGLDNLRWFSWNVKCDDFTPLFNALVNSKE